MKGTPHWLIDDGHGWLVVSLSAVVASGAEITRFSYVSSNGRLAYLEEDCDARAFLDAARIERATATNWPIRRVKRARCRQYPSFAPEVTDLPVRALETDSCDEGGPLPPPLRLCDGPVPTSAAFGGVSLPSRSRPEQD
jgi:hypothetical protein